MDPSISSEMERVLFQQKAAFQMLKILFSFFFFSCKAAASLQQLKA
jgi:hypothetical protein